jgi:lipoprotein LpqB-like beta-propeller protein
MADRRRWWSWRHRRPGKAAATAVLLAVILTPACSAIPTSGTVQWAPTPPALEGGGNGCCGLLIGGPQRGWTPSQVVSSFLLASASFARNHAVARQYLTDQASRLWHPGSTVTILADTPSVVPGLSHVTGPANRTTVVVTGNEVATLKSGQYIPSPGGAATQTFTLELVEGRYKIDGLPPGQGKPSSMLMLTSELFHLGYTPRNLYYYGTPSGPLVPDPVFMPNDSGNPGATLLNDLRHNPGGWLRDATLTSFPPGTRLTVQSQPGKIAVVDMRVPPGTAQPTLRRMAAQVKATLMSFAYGPALFQGVTFKVNGKAWPAGTRVQGPAQPFPSGAVLYYLGSGGAARMLHPLAARGATVPGQAGSGQVPLSHIAVSLDGRAIAGISGKSTVYTAASAAAKQGDHVPGGQLHQRLAGTSFTGLSWDQAGNLWVAGSRHHTDGVWMLPRGQGPAVRVPLPLLPGPVTGLRIAPDGVRVAMIVGTGATARLYIAAIVQQSGKSSIVHPLPVGGGVGHPSALTWYDEDHLLVVTTPGTGTGQPQLKEVPVNGDSPRAVGAPAGMVSIAAFGRSNPMYLSLDDGRLVKSVGFGEPWTDVSAGRAAVYPG